MPELMPPEMPTRTDLRNPDQWPFRHVTVFCDKCGLEQSTDIRADTAEEGFAGLRRLLADKHGWLITQRGDWCAQCGEAKQAPLKTAIRYTGGNPPFKAVAPRD
jgi:hypothetical protein